MVLSRIAQPAPIAVFGPTTLSSTTVPGPMAAGPTMREFTIRAPRGHLDLTDQSAAVIDVPDIRAVMTSSRRWLRSRSPAIVPVSFHHPSKRSPRTASPWCSSHRTASVISSSPRALGAMWPTARWIALVKKYTP